MNALYALVALDAVLGICTVVAGKRNSEHAEGVLAWTTLILMCIAGVLAFIVVG